MKRSIMAYLTLGLATTAAVAQMPSLTTEQEEILKREIGDKVPTDKLECIRRSSLLKLRIVSDDVIIYRAGSKRFLTRTAGTCRGLTGGGKPVIHGETKKICAGDTIFVEDMDSGVRLGTCGMGSFVVYDDSPKEK